MRFRNTQPISSSKRVIYNPWYVVAIEMHKILPLDNLNQIPIDRKILGHHVFAECFSQSKELN